MPTTSSSQRTWGSKSDIGTTAAQLISTTVRAKQGVQVQAHSDNSDTIYIGFGNTVTVTGTDDDTDGYPLAAGNSLLIPITNPNEIFVISGASSQRLNFLII